MEHLNSLVAAAQAGDTEAYGQIVLHFEDMAYGYAYSLLGDFHLAEDAAQEAFIEAYRSLPKLRDAAAFPGWFHRIVRYQCSRFTRGKRLDTVPLEDGLSAPTPGPGPARAVEEREMKDKVLDAIDSLPPPQREVTTLFYINGYTQNQIADFLEVPVNTVKTRLHASRKRLKERMIEMVKGAFGEHQLPADFAGRIIKGVPTLGWDASGTTTYIAAVSAALAPTDRAFDYDSLMVYSGLAFRLRFVRRKDGRSWCGVGPVGQFPEEAEAVARATGCDQPWVRSGDLAEMESRTAAAIDSGYCPFAYIHGDSGVIYGYEDGGRTIYVRCYKFGEGFHRMSFQELLDAPGGSRGPFFLEPKWRPLAPREALIQGLKMAVRNWRRGRLPAERWQPWRGQDQWDYLFGDAAYEAWRHDLAQYDTLGENAQKALRDIYAWTAATLYDARLAAARHLGDNGCVLGGAAQEHIATAARLYRELGDQARSLQDEGALWPIGTYPLGEGNPNPPKQWTKAARQLAIETLTEARGLDAAALTEVENALIAAARAGECEGVPVVVASGHARVLDREWLDEAVSTRVEPVVTPRAGAASTLTLEVENWAELPARLAFSVDSTDAFVVEPVECEVELPATAKQTLEAELRCTSAASSAAPTPTIRWQASFDVSDDGHQCAGEAEIDLRPRVRVPRMGELAGLDALCEAIRGQQAEMLNDGDQTLAELRLAVAGAHLALYARVSDPGCQPDAATWEGAAFDLYVSRPGTRLIRQFVFRPESPSAPGQLTVHENGDQRPDTTMPWRIVPMAPFGYEVQALISLAEAALEPDVQEFLLECGVTVRARDEEPGRFVLLYTHQRGTGAFSSNRGYALAEVASS